MASGQGLGLLASSLGLGLLASGQGLCLLASSQGLGLLARGQGLGLPAGWFDGDPNSLPAVFRGSSAQGLLSGPENQIG